MTPCRMKRFFHPSKSSVIHKEKKIIGLTGPGANMDWMDSPVMIGTAFIPEAGSLKTTPRIARNVQDGL